MFSTSYNYHSSARLTDQATFETSSKVTSVPKAIIPAFTQSANRSLEPALNTATRKDLSEFSLLKQLSELRSTTLLPYPRGGVIVTSSSGRKAPWTARPFDSLDDQQDLSESPKPLSPYI